MFKVKFMAEGGQWGISWPYQKIETYDKKEALIRAYELNFWRVEDMIIIDKRKLAEIWEVLEDRSEIRREDLEDFVIEKIKEVINQTQEVRDRFEKILKKLRNKKEEKIFKTFK